METILPSRPENYRSLLKRSIKLYRVSFTRILYLSFLLSFIVFIPRLLSDIIGQDIFLGIPALSPERWWLVLINIAATIFFIAILWRMHCVIRGKHEPYVEDFKVGIRKFILVMLATLFESVILFGFSMLIFGSQALLNQYSVFIAQYGVILVLITFVMLAEIFLLAYAATLFIFMTPIIAIENKNIFHAIERSWLIVWDHWWRVFSLQATPWVIYLAILFLFRLVFQVNIHIYFMEQSQHFFGTTILHIIISALFIPWVAATLLVQLKDLELRKHIKVKS